MSAKKSSLDVWVGREENRRGVVLELTSKFLTSLDAHQVDALLEPLSQDQRTQFLKLHKEQIDRDIDKARRPRKKRVPKKCG